MSSIVDFTNFRFRASSGGRLAAGMKVGLSEAQEKSYQHLVAKNEVGGLTTNQVKSLGDLYEKRDATPSLSVGCKNWLKTTHWQEVTGRREIISNWYTEKGLRVEQDSLSTHNKLTKTFKRKNEKHFKNAFFQGTPDEFDKVKVRDIKSNFTLNTFPIHETRIKNDIYFWQLQIYMDLLKLKQAELIYVLENTPTDIVNDVLKSLDWKYKTSNIEGTIYPAAISLVVETVTNHLFTFDALNEFCQQSSNVKREWFDNFIELPAQMRVKVFELDYDPEAIKSLKRQAISARKYLNSLSLETAERLFVTL